MINIDYGHQVEFCATYLATLRMVVIDIAKHIDYLQSFSRFVLEEHRPADIGVNFDGNEQTVGVWVTTADGHLISKLIVDLNGTTWVCRELHPAHRVWYDAIEMTLEETDNVQALLAAIYNGNTEHIAYEATTEE